VQRREALRIYLKTLKLLIGRSLDGLTSFSSAPVLPDGTYELVGPKIQGNAEGFVEHVLVSHDLTGMYPDAPRTFNELREWLSGMDIEGIVFHHPDGRMAKIKKRDFGIRRK
jgi:hypothetical protein